MARDAPYHHGDLRPVLIAVATEVIGEHGATSMSMRDVARRAGVSHTAAMYHFGDKAGLLAAVAAEGYESLRDTLADAQRRHRSFLEVGVAYVRFAVAHPAHFEVMFHPTMYDANDPAVVAARQETAALLYGSRNATARQMEAGMAAWSLVHGLATLWLGGSVPRQLTDDPEELTRAVASHLRVRRR